MRQEDIQDMEAAVAVLDRTGRSIEKATTVLEGNSPFS